MDEIMRAFLTGEFVSVEACEYDEKTIAERERDNIIDLLFSEADLNYNKSGLNFSGCAIEVYLKAVYPNRYEKKFKTLLEENAQRD